MSAIRTVVDTDDAVPFAEPVDVENYHAIVPVPMDLGLIVRRLEKVIFEFLEILCVSVEDSHWFMI